MTVANSKLVNGCEIRNLPERVPVVRMGNIILHTLSKLNKVLTADFVQLVLQIRFPGYRDRTFRFYEALIIGRISYINWLFIYFARMATNLISLK